MALDPRSRLRESFLSSAFLFLFLFTIILTGGGCTHSSESLSPSLASCLERRAALDLGSGTTKMVVADVDLCAGSSGDSVTRLARRSTPGQIQKILWMKKVKLPFQEDLEREGGQGNFSPEFQEQAIKVLKNLLREAKEQFPFEQKRAVATSAFRKARNGEEFARVILEKLSLKVTVIDQIEEGRLGFWGACSQIRQESPLISCEEKLWVWDIGGGSMQMSAYDSKGDFRIYEGQLASVTFKNMVIEAVLGQDSQKITSPNPLGPEKGAKASRMAAYYAKVHVPAAVADLARHRTVIGVGGVHNGSLKGQFQKAAHDSALEKLSYTLSELQRLVAKRIFFNDRKLESPYASTEVTNLLLVDGFMQALGLNEVHLREIELNHGLLIDQNYWKSRTY